MHNQLQKMISLASPIKKILCKAVIRHSTNSHLGYLVIDATTVVNQNCRECRSTSISIARPWQGFNMQVIPNPLCRQIVHAEGPSGPNRDYLFQLEKALLQIGKFLLTFIHMFHCSCNNLSFFFTIFLARMQGQTHNGSCK